MGNVVIRDAQQADFEDIIAINKEYQHFTSEMQMDKTRHLDSESCYHRVAEVNGEVAAFLIAMGPRADYKSPNYVWFSEQYEDFIYVDRIVISGRQHRQGFGAKLYEDLFAFAREKSVANITCEYYTTPANPVSAAFHTKFGFAEVGTLVLEEGKKVVSLQRAKVS